MAKKSNTKVKNIVLVIIIFGIISYALIYFSNNSSNSDFGSDFGLMSSKYAVSIEKINNTISSFDNNIFSNSVYQSLRSFVKLPLELGRVGKENPFEAPPAPIDLLLEGRQ